MTKINQESVQSVIVIRSCPKKGGCQEVIKLLRQSILQEVTLEDEYTLSRCKTSGLHWRRHGDIACVVPGTEERIGQFAWKL